MRIRWGQIIVLGVVVLGIAMALMLRNYPGKATAHLVSVNNPAKSTFNVSVDSTQSIAIGIFGESRGDTNTGKSFDENVLTSLFNVFKNNHVVAVFATGNLVSGLSEAKEHETPSPNKKAFKKQLDAFSTLYDGVLGDKIPFFPVMGGHEMAVPGGVRSFINHFNLEDSQILYPGAFAYTVSIGPALFVMIPTDGYNADTNAEQTFEPQTLDWLEQVLQANAKQYSYLFVVGYEPAFPITSTFSSPHTDEREAFWKILEHNGVLAYFASHEHLFDRSNRHGVWQIISGGGGAPLREGENRLASSKSTPFFHSLILTLPADGKGKPFIKVIGIDGKVDDEFELTPGKELIYQRHIT